MGYISGRMTRPLLLRAVLRACCALPLLLPLGALAGPDALRIQTDPERAVVRFMGWDTEGGGRAGTNLLRAGTGISLRFQIGGQWRDGAERPAKREQPDAATTRYQLNVAPEVDAEWSIERKADSLFMRISGHRAAWSVVQAVELVFPFDPQVTPTTVLPKSWDEKGELLLPAIISAPDFGQFLISSEAGGKVKGRLQGSRANHAVDLVIELPQLLNNDTCVLSLTPVHLAAPKGLKDKSLWQEARRGWFGALQCSAEWGDAGNPFSAPAGMLANNVVSDPASCSLWFYADQAFWTPELAPGISSMSLVRRTLDWWLTGKVLTNGEVICYWDKAHFLDANAGPLIAAWDYVEATGDRDWLAKRLERLEFIADFLAHRDVDGEGLVEAFQSGNSGTLQEPARSCAWWDALNCGGKDSYSNALIYRAWRCLADLEAKAQRHAQQARYTQLADRLKASYAKTLLNPQTGWLAWWKSQDGQLHDYASPVVNGLAIEYGLVPPEQGREILARLRRKMAEVGFTRFDLGVPPMLVPVHRGDYLLPAAIGCPTREDGRDTFGYYMNGAITAGQVLHFLAAHYVVGEGVEADQILRAMLGREAQGGFQNGAINAYPKGIDWTTWDGRPAGYEGYLADSFRFLQAVPLREPRLRARLYRPLTPPKS
jgi:hypothetical protein